MGTFHTMSTWNPNSLWARELYSVWHRAEGYMVCKFDGYYNPIKVHLVYSGHLGKRKCTCEKGSYPSCRHRLLIDIFSQRMRVGVGWFYEYYSQEWENPIIRPSMAEIAAMKERAS